MPSTFTTSGVELIADGEQSAAWGQTTNGNLQIIDRMTSQAGTITLSGTTHTLTVSNGILSDGQYNVLVFAGSPSGTNTVTVNPNTAQRTFFVRNTTSQSVVLTQGSGGNVTVPSNTSKVVYTNGAGAGAAVFDITNTVAANVTGNAGTATALQAARTLTIGSTGKAFDGTANVAWTLSEIGVNNATLTLATSGIATGSQTFTANQGTNATFTVNVPATDLSVTGGTTAGPTINSSTGTNVTIPTASGTASGVVTTGAQTFAGTKTFSSTITGSVSGNAGTATTLQTARTIGGVSFDGSANINLPGVNQAGNQNTTGNAATATKWATARNLTINGISKSVDGTANVAFTGPEVGSVPSGGIIMWSGSIVNIPSGWLLCDGTNGTPDLRNRFVVGAGSTYAVNATGGSADAIVVAHTHTYSGTTSTASLTGTFTASKPANATGVFGVEATTISPGGDGAQASATRYNMDASHNHTFSGTTASTGSSGTNANLPPYFALAYIMKA